ncbi:MAG: hypothetical protein U0264_09670 [Candidatus Kapaibacterium sp.]
MNRFLHSRLWLVAMLFPVFSHITVAGGKVKPVATVFATIDLVGLDSDMVKITVIPPPLVKDKPYIYIMPASVPGTYAQYDFGRFVRNFRAFDKKGNLLEVTHTTANEFAIASSEKLAKIEYWTVDTFDDLTDSLEVFNPVGTNFQKDSNYLLSYPGLIGYFDGYKTLPYEVKILKPAEMYGATAIKKKEVSGGEDIMYAKNYDELVDNPAMYSRPDTVSYRQGNATISVAVYSMTGTVKASFVASVLKPITKAVERFFGSMPVDHYSFILYYTAPGRRDINRKGGLGALEHNYCSMYFMMESSDTNQVRGFLNRTASHEFLHILVPLHLHSEEIADFDFRNPKMSKHLWLYEGVTEYFATLAQIHDTLVTEKEALSIFRQKIFTQGFMSFKPVSLTELSTRVLEPEWQKVYPIIYEKGALVGLMLDIRLLELTGGKLDLLGLVNLLTKKFGTEKPFKDEELFDVIYAATSPDIKPLFDSIVIGKEPMPYTDYFEKIGWEYSPMKTIQAYSFGKIKLDMNHTSQRVYVDEVDSTYLLGLKSGDTLIKFNQKKLDEDEVQEEFWFSLMRPQDSSQVELTVLRGGAEVNVKGSPAMSERKERFYLKELPNATPAQIALRKRIFYQ